MTNFDQIIHWYTNSIIMNKFTIAAWGLILLSFFAFTGCQSKKESAGPKGRPIPKVDAYVVSPSTLVNEITVSGSLLPFEEVELKNEVAGRVVKLNLPEGKFVKSGTLLVKIFDDDLQANLRKLQSQLAIQEKILQRQNELLKVNGVSQNDYDQASLTVSSLNAEIEVQKAQIRKTEVLAPFDGVIGLRNVSPGAVVATSTLLATIRQDSKLKLDFSVPEKYSGMIVAGLNVKFTVQGDTSIYNASVMATEQGIETSTRNLRVRAVVENKSKTLIPGAYTNVELSLGENTNALMVPTNAIIPLERTKSVILNKGGKAHFVEVQTGIRNTETIEITSGIQAGDTVITSGVLFLKEGNKLEYASIKTDAL
jgi:membrane fusion protein, multidrug efflux system